MNQIETPVFLVDWNKTRLNAEMMIQKAKKASVRLRPHVKTHKTLEIAAFQSQDIGNPITVSTIAELLFYYQSGFKDCTYAVPITFEKWKKLALNESINLNSINFLTDDLDTTISINKKASDLNTQVNLFLKIDSGAHRAGLQPKSERLLDLATFVNEASNLNLIGLLTHAGQSYNTSEAEQKKEIVKQEIDSIVHSAEWLESKGIEIRERSIGSTPTMMQAVDLKGITEIRPGNYIWFDLFQFHRGNCELDQIACSVLTAIIGVYPERNTILVDAGALALSKDAGFYQNGKVLFGQIKNHPDWELVSLSQEHGIIQIGNTDWTNLKVGDYLEIIPNHSCLTAACFEFYYCINDGKSIQKIKPIKFF